MDFSSPLCGSGRGFNEGFIVYIIAREANLRGKVSQSASFIKASFIKLYPSPFLVVFFQKRSSYFEFPLRQFSFQTFQ